MATTKISDLFIQDLATSYTANSTLAKNAFFMSGVAFQDPRVNALMDATQGGQLISMPYYNPLTDGNYNIGNDDPTQKSTPDKIDTGYETAVKTYMNKSYSVMDLAALAVQGEPMTAINSGIQKYWTNISEARIIAATTGIIADSIANHDSDLLYDITDQTGDGKNPYLNAQVMNTAAGYLGESMTDIKVVCVHPAVFTNLRNLNIIATMQEGATRTLFQTYEDYFIIVDKNMPKQSVGGGKYAYYTYMYGSNAITYQYGNPGVEYEIWRDPASGNGAGEEVLFTRRCDLVLPRGYQTTAVGGKAGLSEAALGTASTWTRAWNDADARERIKFVAVKTLG